MLTVAIIQDLSVKSMCREVARGQENKGPLKAGQIEK
jgi:hypothetical protein